MVNIKLSHAWRAILLWRPAGLGADPVNAWTIHYPTYNSADVRLPRVIFSRGMGYNC